MGEGKETSKVHEKHGVSLESRVLRLTIFYVIKMNNLIWAAQDPQ